MRYSTLLASLALIASSAVHAAGPYAPAAGKSGSTAISYLDSSITHWATGWLDYKVGSDVAANWQTPTQALGRAWENDVYGIVSLGNGGSITMTFNGRIVNGAGADFAVFENSFGDTFLELARVEVSSNGTDFFRFPAVSFTSKAVGAFGAVDPTNIDGFAGKYRGGYGTGFDLATLAGNAKLDINNVQYVRVVDVLGNGTEYDDWTGPGGPHKIYDPYRTVGSGGFDLDAIGVMHFAVAAPVPEPESYAMLLSGLGLLSLLARRRRVNAAR